jgi:hypothetical protein
MLIHNSDLHIRKLKNFVDPHPDRILTRNAATTAVQLTGSSLERWVGAAFLSRNPLPSFSLMLLFLKHNKKYIEGIVIK